MGSYLAITGFQESGVRDAKYPAVCVKIVQNLLTEGILGAAEFWKRKIYFKISRGSEICLLFLSQVTFGDVSPVTVLVRCILGSTS